MYSQLHGIVHQVCTRELSYPCLLFEWPKESLCNQAFTARSSGLACDTGGFEGVGFGCRPPTSVFLANFRVADYLDTIWSETIARMSRFSRTRLRLFPAPRTTTSTMAPAKSSARITWLGNTTRKNG